tara:strand:- start:4772 stop:5614 length:843 start_codon:yes stop_codon:yes gene_type:complete
MFYKIYLFSFIFIYSNLCADDRLVTIGGSVTEIAFALGLGNSIIAVDQSSTLPRKVSSLKQVGYIRALSAEGILSVMPSLILSSSDIGPPNVIKQLKKSRVNLEIFKSPKNYDEVIQLVNDMSHTLDLETKGEELILKLSEDYKKIQKLISSYKKTPNVVFFMDTNNSGSFNAAGSGTRADYLIELVGCNNIYKEEFKRYNKVSSESLLNMNPDVILIGGMLKDSALRSSILDNKNLTKLNAVRNNKVFSIDLGYHLTFGTNISIAAIELINLINIDSNE